MHVIETGLISLDEHERDVFGSDTEIVEPGDFSAGQTHDVWARANKVGREIARLTGNRLFRMAVGRNRGRFKPENYTGIQSDRLRACLTDLDTIAAVGGAVLAYEVETIMYFEDGEWLQKQSCFSRKRASVRVFAQDSITLLDEIR